MHVHKPTNIQIKYIHTANTITHLLPFPDNRSLIHYSYFHQISFMLLWFGNYERIFQSPFVHHRIEREG